MRRTFRLVEHTWTWVVPSVPPRRRGWWSGFARNEPLSREGRHASQLTIG
jgi:hypothetical protein